MRAFVKQGGCVFSCVFSFGEFRFEVAETQNEVNKFSGSKYVKSNPEGIYKQVYERLRNNRKVLFIGLPCQVAAVKNYIGETRIENLYTVDLICHGTPSPKLFDIFLKQYGYNLSTLEHIGFRAKTIYQVSINQKNIGVPSTCDKYTISFLNSISFTENCYSCKYAKKERVSDITLGDSWGSELSDEIQKKGVSLILCQTNKGKELLDMSKLYLESVNLEKAIQSNHQLVHPSIKPEKRTLFFKIIKKGKSFNKAVQRCYPKICFKQFVKSTLIKISNFFCSFV